jgi:hypothetical protein
MIDHDIQPLRWCLRDKLDSPQPCDKAERIAANFAKLRELLRRKG